jgi:hypothetical protein
MVLIFALLLVVLVGLLGVGALVALGYTLRGAAKPGR